MPENTWTPPGGTPGRGPEFDGRGKASGAKKSTGLGRTQSRIVIVGDEPRTILVRAYENRDWRIERLERVARMALAQNLPVTHIYDEKGCLSVAISDGEPRKFLKPVQRLWRRAGEWNVTAVHRGDMFAAGDPSCEGCVLRNFPDAYFTDTRTSTSDA